MLKMSRSFVVRMTLWSVLVLYIVCDFFVFNGSLRSELREIFSTPEDKAARAMAQGICAKVWNGPVYRSQVDRRVREKLWRTGRDPEKVGAREMKLLRWAALDELIGEAVLRIKVRANRDDFPVSEAEIDAEVERFEKRFANAAALDDALAAQGIESRRELRFRLAARLQQEKYLESKIGGAVRVGTQEAKDWYAAHTGQLTLPERRRVRHIFLAALDHPADEAKATLSAHLEQLRKHPASFPEIAARTSEDAASKTKGGDLGWMARGRLPADFAATVFSLQAHTPALVRTKLGWHIVEVTGIAPPALPPFEQLEKSIVAALADGKREQAVKQYRHQIRLLNKDQIKIFPAMLD